MQAGCDMYGSYLMLLVLLRIPAFHLSRWLWRNHLDSPRNKLWNSEKISWKGAVLRCSRGTCGSTVIKSSKGNGMNDAERSIPLWFGKARLFLLFSSQDAIPDSTATELGTEFWFVQYFQVRNKEELFIDGLHQCLNFVRLRWDRTTGEAWKFSVGKIILPHPMWQYPQTSSARTCRCSYNIDG